MTIKYSFVYDNPTGDNMMHIKIDEGDFAGIIYKYGRVQFGEQTTEGYRHVNFQYDIIEDDKNIINEKNTNIFIDIIGDILIDLIEKQLNQIKGNGGGQYKTN